MFGGFDDQCTMRVNNTRGWFMLHVSQFLFDQGLGLLIYKSRRGLTDLAYTDDQGVLKGL